MTRFRFVAILALLWASLACTYDHVVCVWAGEEVARKEKVLVECDSSKLPAVLEALHSVYVKGTILDSDARDVRVPLCESAWQHFPSAFLLELRGAVKRMSEVGVQVLSVALLGGTLRLELTGKTRHWLRENITQDLEHRLLQHTYEGLRVGLAVGLPQETHAGVAQTVQFTCIGPVSQGDAALQARAPRETLVRVLTESTVVSGVRRLQLEEVPALNAADIRADRIRLEGRSDPTDVETVLFLLAHIRLSPLLMEAVEELGIAWSASTAVSPGNHAHLGVLRIGCTLLIPQ